MNGGVTVVMRCLKTAMLGIALVILSAGWSRPLRAADVSFDFFYSNLSPHGSWLVSDEYGQVWQPRVYVADWNPYYDGHWVYTDLGWAWVSDYSWGTIPYHYGTWVMDADYGWIWVPGYVWAPAWVVFRTGPDYIGWAPVSPRYSLSLSRSFSQPAPGPFVFVSSRDFVARHVRRYIIPERQTTVILNNTRIVNSLAIENSVVVNRGPNPRLIERASGQPIREVRIEQVRGVAPDPHVSRAKLQVDPQRMREGLRVAEPTRGEQRQPGGRRQESNPGDSERSKHPDGMTHQPRPGKQPRESVAPRSDPRGQPSESVTPRTNPQKQPRESLKPSQKPVKPLPPQGSNEKQEGDKKKKPPKKEPGHETGLSDAH
jgi:uncharacterized protein DUF6600